MSRRACIFCGRNERMSREHLFARWLREAFPQLGNDQIQMTWRNATPAAVVSEHTWRGELLGNRVRRVCIECNNGWMSQLEERTRPILAPMAMGQPSEIATVDQIVLATWAVKTAIVSEWLGQETPIYTEADRHVVMNQDRPPAHCQVRLAAYEGTGLPLAVYRMVYGLNRASLPVERYASLVTLIIGCAVLQVFADRGQLEQALVKGPGGGPFHLNVFPPRLNTVSWPPSNTLDDQTLQAFVEVLGPLVLS